MTIGMPPYEELSSFEEVLERAHRVADGLSRSYVSDAVFFGRWIRLRAVSREWLEKLPIDDAVRKQILAAFDADVQNR